MQSFVSKMRWVRIARTRDIRLRSSVSSVYDQCVVISPKLWARATACARFSEPSLMKMCLTCDFTVSGVMASERAISLLDRPWAMSLRIAASRPPSQQYARQWTRSRLSASRCSIGGRVFDIAQCRFLKQQLISGKAELVKQMNMSRNIGDKSHISRVALDRFLKFG
jgi:hypothetical protein